MKRLIIICIALLLPVAAVAWMNVATVGGGGVPAGAPASDYNHWDSRDDTAELATNESLAGTNDITESAGAQTLDINGTSDSCYTYATFTQFDTSSFYYFDINFKFNESFATAWQNNYFLFATNTGTSPNTTTKAFMVYARYKGSNTWDIYFYSEDNGSNTYSPTYTAGSGDNIQLRVRIKIDDSTNIQCKWNDAAAVEISTNGAISRQVDRVFMGASSFGSNANITVTKVGITTNISEIGLATWE